MKEILQAVLALPDLPPSDNQFQSAYSRMSQRILEWNKTIAKTWSKITPDILGNDELLALTVELLPNDRKQLSQLKAQLERAMDSELADEIGFTITNFYCAVLFKLEAKNGKPAAEEKKLYNNIALTIKILNEQEQLITQLKQLFGTHKRYLMGLIKEKWKSNYQLSSIDFQNKYADMNGNADIVFISDFQKSLPPSTGKEDEKLVTMLEKFIIISDIYHTLEKENMDYAHKLEEFGAKLSQHIKLLQTNTDEKGASFLETISVHFPYASHLKAARTYIGYDRFSYFFTWQTKEDKFAKNIAGIAEKIGYQSTEPTNKPR
ncbi:hypothetical protein [Aquicella lusitana]|uniref:Uncharacterized protein n=1 Tax=Aquicella lusitana TaxID=254246 RepID=A0A370G8W5_9COXI|nr:hypothetical protein [Aquicella lusitana]RDI40207.1 hypothetical protein C8D86_12343 [Aquicella lusitana]VVC72402.1 hypothetical protein AQULUS_01120 [Aquicella lusitana]